MSEILRILSEDAKATPAQIATLLGRSEEDVAREIKDLEDKLARVEIIDPTKLSGSRVRFGATVSLSNVETSETSTFARCGWPWSSMMQEGKGFTRSAFE